MIRLTKRRKLSAAGGTIALAAVGWLRCGPVPAELLDNRRTASVVVLDRNDRPLYEALSADGSRSETLEASDLPPAIVDATIAAEDRRFWWHPGIDPIAIVRACLADIRHGGAVEGGSTISQQAAKLLLGGDGSRHRGIRAKISEALLALRLEHRFSKREILAMYLNRASYGNQIAGVERASHAYFGRPSKLLTPAQAAFLAGLPQRPSGFNPYRSFNDAVRRQRSVLRRMAATHVLSDDQVKEALAERLVLVRDKSPFAAPHFVEMALAAAGDSRTVRTTLDRELQADVVGILRARRDLLTSHGAYNVAVVVLDNASSEWLAWEGSRDSPVRR